ncbi:hypothetical protein CHS0354_021685 [Potamilus streckersoni]|uniref:RBR-type E3 ubiquitin transferase n=1 Tax=Potamilus streckersoni TaxID=2493646 RepID=A0AAE0TLB5_9BIVA|nr:hypothetical protein CHS0354_021685 [Potamilus streckersoni]
MVLKIGKRGIHSGNSLKGPTSSYLRRYRREAMLTRSSIRRPNESSDSDQVLGDLYIEENDVAYSLNKKGRWSLPRLIKESISRGEYDDCTFGVQLVEYHKIKKRSNCVGLYSTIGPVKQLKEKRGRRKKSGYVLAASILNARPAGFGRRRKKSRHNRHQQVGGAEEDTDGKNVEQQKPITLYEVFYPSPITSSICHNAKYIRPYSFPTDGQSKRRRAHRGRKRGLSEIVKHELDMMYDSEEDFDVNDEDIRDDLEEGNSSFHHGSTDLSLDDLLSHALRTSDRFDQNFKREGYLSVQESAYQWNAEKQNIVYIERKNRKDIKSNSKNVTGKKNYKAETNVIDPTITEPVHIILSTEEISYHSLREKFDDKVIFCECIPRKFILDITETLRRSSLFKTGKFHILACLVFSHDVNNEINNELEHVYRVHLNMKMTTCLRSLKIETLFDYMESTVDELVQRTVFFMETLPEETFMPRTFPIVGKALTNFQNLKDCSKWDCGSYLPDDCLFYNNVFRINKDDVSPELEGYELVGPDEVMCYICYEELGGSVRSTALLKCGHMFCDSCWREHLLTSIKEGSRKMVCPEYECEKEVDVGTMMSLINLEDLLKFQKRCHDYHVEEGLAAKWCPNARCGRVLQTTLKGPVIVHCECGLALCFVCLQEAHWPAPCERASTYRDKLRKSGDESIIPVEVIKDVEVRGKNCPFCKRFFEKNGGCPHMVCPCGQAFCWGCLKSWEGNLHNGGDCFKYGYSSTAYTTLVNIQPEDILMHRKRHKWYKLALQQRTQRHPLKTKMMKSALPGLSQKLKYYFIKKCPVGECEKLRNYVVKGARISSDAEKIPHLLKNLIDLYMEVHHLVEYTAVLLESEELVNYRAPVNSIILRMDALTNFIFSLFENNPDGDPRQILTKALNLHEQCRKCIGALVRVVVSIRS